MALFLRVYLAALPGAVVATVVCNLINIGFLGLEDNPNLTAYLYFGVPIILTVTPVALYILTRAGAYKSPNWVVPTLVVGVILGIWGQLTILVFHAAMPTLFTEYLGTGRFAIYAAMAMQFCSGFPSIVTYAVFYGLIVRNTRVLGPYARLAGQ